MAEAVVALVVERIDDLLIEDANVLDGMRDQIQEILEEFRWIQGLLKYADTRKEERVRVWIADVRKLVYDAEDVVESFVLKFSYMKKGGIKSIFKRYVYHKFRSAIKAIKNKISGLKARLGEDDMRFILQEASSSSTNERQSELTRFHSYRNVAEEEVVGFKEDLDALVKILEGSSETCHRVVSICGMGGLGKTTLSKKIYNTPAIKSHFECLAWVSISQNLHKINVLQRILVQLVPDPDPKKREEILKLSEDALVEKILAVQQSKNCLIVLDDIWKKEDWDNLRAAFSSGHAKNKLLLTSRNLEVAKHVDPEGFLYQPRILSEDESWELLAMKALPNKDLTENRFVKQMEELGRKMVMHCKGLPLAIVVLGGILVTKPTLTEWERVFHDVERSLSKGKGLGTEHQKEVDEILVLSYTDLPYQLKPCFIYLGTFLEDSVIKTKKLYQMWMAEGLLFKKDRREGETMMNVAECYLRELAHRCMVEVEIEENKSSIRKLKSCRTHDLMRDLSISKAKEEDFFKFLDYQHDNQLVGYSSSSSTNYTRRLMINHAGEGITSKDIPLDNEGIRHLRSLIFNGINADLGRLPHILRSDLAKFKLLKVLSIEGVEYLSSELNACYFFLDSYKGARAIGYLKHLRYLSLRGSDSMMFPSLANKEYLQTLDLRVNEDVFVLSSTIKSMLKGMGRLLHLYLPQRILIEIRVLFGENKLRLDDFRNLETLRNFDPTWCEIKDIFNLTNLRELTAFVNCIEDLSEIINYHSSISSTNLRYSSLFIDECDLSSDKGSFLLRQLLLNGGSKVNKLFLWECKVKLQADDHVNFSSNLTNLMIFSSSEFEEHHLVPIVGKLPNLRQFRLIQAHTMTELVCSATSFPQLRFLQLSNLEMLERWRVDEGAMPCLSELQIVECLRLKMLPDGIKFLIALRALKIIRMPEAFNDRIRVVNGKEGEDFHKVRNVPSITFW